MHYDEDRKKIYKEIYEHKMSYAHKNKMIHVPRYWIVIIWGFFITFAIYVYALNTINDLNHFNYSIDNMAVPQRVQKVKATIEFLPNETEPRFVQVPEL